jgi:Ca2+-binding EF-hand superfamily protein
MVSKDSSRADPGKTKEIKQFFEAMDANGSGTIDAKELKGLITAML